MLAGKLTALTVKVMELPLAKEFDAKDAEEAVNWLEVEKVALQSDLDVALAQSERKFNKGNGWHVSGTRYGHDITDLHHKLDFLFFIVQKRVL